MKKNNTDYSDKFSLYRCGDNHPLNAFKTFGIVMTYVGRRGVKLTLYLLLFVIAGSILLNIFSNKDGIGQLTIVSIIVTTYAFFVSLFVYGVAGLMQKIRCSFQYEIIKEEEIYAKKLMHDPALSFRQFFGSQKNYFRDRLWGILIVAIYMIPFFGGIALIVFLIGVFK